jgi:threonylcarbamoyladenosine tRNA methylthiotransferase MtaB
LSKSVILHTLGCKLNYSETSTLAWSFKSRGYNILEYGESSDIFVLNTCTVTDNADKECRQIIRSVLNRKPNTYVIITGCYAQLQPHEIAEIHGVDLVLGTNEKFKLFDYIDNFEKKDYSCVFTSPSDEITDFDYAYSSDTDSRTRAFLKIQDGCDYNCAFCTIPLARGKSRSLPIDKVIENAKKIIDAGYQEIVLTGVNTGDYNYTISNGDELKDYHLINVLYELDKLDIKRLRISSIEPNLLTDEIIQLVKSSEKFCNHFHIPLQSGDDNVLKLMRRRYNTLFYKELISKLNHEIPDAGIGVDVIVGHPGETDENFENTCNYLDNLQICYLHVFSYSERKNTHAVTISGNIDIKKRKLRSKILRELSTKKKSEFYKKFCGTEQYVLFETIKDDNCIYGFTENYIRVRLNNSDNVNLKNFENKIQKVVLTKNESIKYFEAEII